MKYQLKRDSVVTILQSKYSILDEEGGFLYEAKQGMFGIKQSFEFSQGGEVVALVEKNFMKNIYQVTVNGQSRGELRSRFSLTNPLIFTLDEKEYKIKKPFFKAEFKMLDGEKEVAKLSHKSEEKKSFKESVKASLSLTRYITIDDSLEQLPFLAILATIEINSQNQRSRSRR